MDNHRLALWCWWQHLNDAPLWKFLHIDRHFDAQWGGTRPWTTHHKPVHRTDLDAFRNATWTKGTDVYELYRWDTITSALHTLDDALVTEWWFATAEEGCRPAIPRATEISPWAVPAALRYLAAPDRSPCQSIIDIDIDYFSHCDIDGPFGRVFSDQYLRELGATVAEGLANGQFGVVTVALSPTTTGSWGLSEEIAWALLEAQPEIGQWRAGAP